MKLVEYNQLNDVVSTKIKFDRIISIAKNSIEEPLAIAAISLIGGRKSRLNFNSDIIFLWDRRATYTTINNNYINLSRKTL